VTRPTRPVALLVLVLTLVLSAAGCSFSGDEPATLGPRATPSPSATPSSPQPSGSARKAPDPALQPFYDQEVSWEPCDGGNECGTLEVPLDYDDPDGKTIELALLKNPAEGNRVGNLVVNPGGPGAPGTDYARNAGFAFRKQLRSAFDIIGFDPRGTGGSDPVDCLSDRDVDGYLAVDPDPDTPAEVDELQGWIDRIGQGCTDTSGALAAHVSTGEAARDMDVLRAALGDQTLTYLGASYGTKLGATYAELFPKRAGRLVLDGAVDPSLSSRQSSLGQARGFQRALDAYVDDCLEESDCFLGDSRQEGLDKISDFLAEVDRGPIEVGSRELTVGNAFYGIVTPLYNQDYWDSFLTPALEQGFQGKGTMLLALSDIYASRSADGTYENNSSEAFYAISCLDDSTSVPLSKVPAQFPAFERASPTFGKVFAWGLAGCGGSEAPESKGVGTIDAAGAPPILVVGTTRDPATPYEWAQALASQLESGVLVTRDGDGHTGYNMGNSCVDTTVESFLIDGTAPSSDKDCGS
jgi:pimeloyl-ACP methyl ester carboxylesterase